MIPDSRFPIQVPRSMSGGFTLVELVLYISIAFVMLSLVSIFIAATLESRVKGQTIAEVEQGGVQAMDLITQTIRNAEGINPPATSTTASSMSLKISDLSKDPTIFDLVSGKIRITEGANPPVEITGSKLSVNNLSFSNLSRANTHGIIRIEIDIAHANPSGRNEFEFFKKFTTSASLK